MSWWAWVLLAGCLLGCVLWYRRVVWWFATGEGRHPDRFDGEDLVFGLIFGLMIAALWPLAALVFGFRWLYKRQPAIFHKIILPPPRNVRAELRARDLDQRERQLRRREERLGTLADRYARGEIDLPQLEAETFAAFEE